MFSAHSTSIHKTSFLHRTLVACISTWAQNLNALSPYQQAVAVSTYFFQSPYRNVMRSSADTVHF